MFDRLLNMPLSIKKNATVKSWMYAQGLYPAKGLFWWAYIGVSSHPCGLKRGMDFLLKPKWSNFLSIKTSIFKTLKLTKSNQIKLLLVPLHNRMTCFETGVTELPRDASTEGQKYCVRMKCMEEPTNKAICAKKLKGLNFF